MILWFTGQPGSGKTTLCDKLKDDILYSYYYLKHKIIHLDGDDTREILDNKDYSEAGRRKNIQFTIDMARVLSNKGFLRAENWKRFFIDKNISRIYSTNYKRTIKTVKPLAENNNLEILIYSSDDIIYKIFSKSSIGENTLVVGHSNTIPVFVNNLIEEDYYDQIDDLNNSNLYIVSLCDSSITHKLVTVD